MYNMAQALATVFLVAIVIGVVKMVFDVQVAKLKRMFNELKEHFDEN